VPFCAYKNSSGCPKTLAIRQTGPEIGDGVVPFVPAPKVAVPRKLLKRSGVPNQLRLNDEDQFFNDLQSVSQTAAVAHGVLVRLGLPDDESVI
jgi:hypothetical protein